MSFKKTIHVVTLGFALLLNACASNSWSDAQKNTLTDLRINQPTFDENAYSQPNAKDSHLLEENTKANQLGQSQGFGLVGLVLLVADGAISTVQQTKFDSKNKQHYDAVKQQINAQSTAQLSEKLTSTIQSNPFFSKKITNDSKNVFKLNVNNHGLARTADTSVDDMKMFYGIKAYASLINQNGEEMLGKTLFGRSNTVATMTELLANNFSVLNKMKNEAQDNLTNDLKLDLLDKSTSQAEKNAKKSK